MTSFSKRLSLLALVVSLCVVSTGLSQIMEGELRVVVRDPEGRPVPAEVNLVSRDPEFETSVRAGSDGVVRILRLRPAVYALTVRQPGFAEFNEIVEVRSAVPLEQRVELALAIAAETVTVRAPAPLVDRAQPTLVMEAGRQQLEESLGSTPGRGTVDVITTLPGWLLEANAVLHPRGSEYDTQYVVDGMPFYDNRSIGFAPAFEPSEFEAVNVMTAGIPAEYGRRLGGVISLDTRRDAVPGQSGELDARVGSFGTVMGSASHQYRTDRGAIAIGIQSGHTDRYLDPPSLENFTNKSTSGGMNFRLERDLADRDRVRVYLRSNRARFLVPNDRAQQAAGQRQDRFTRETSGQIHYQHTFSPQMLGSTRLMVRNLRAELWSNQLAAPVWVEQDRGLRDVSLLVNLAIEEEGHSIKLGGDFRTANIREEFRFAEPDELPVLDVDFRDSERSHEASAFIQDHLRIGDFAANVGLRFDHHGLLVTENAWSPRVGVSYWFSPADVLLRASYDRVFQPPPIENLLFSSAAAGLGLDDVEQGLDVPASRAHFFEVGFRKPLSDVLRIDVSHYWRKSNNYIDDDVFLNTGVSFPISFTRARIEGTEVRVELLSWKGVSGSISYANMLGTATSPVTGGLFVEGGEAEELRDIAETFAISQDQRNTLATLVRFQPHSRIWFLNSIRYGSGLPVELEDEETQQGGGPGESQQIDTAVAGKVDFVRGRLRPNFSIDFGIGTRMWEAQDRSITVQFDVRNVTDRLNVINFDGVFSGTALAPGRQASIEARFRF